MGQTLSAYPGGISGTTLDPEICPRQSWGTASASPHPAAISACSLLLVHPQPRSRDVPFTSGPHSGASQGVTGAQQRQWHHTGASSDDAVAMTGSGRKLKKVRWDVSCQERRAPLRLEASAAARASHSAVLWPGKTSLHFLQLRFPTARAQRGAGRCFAEPGKSYRLQHGVGWGAGAFPARAIPWCPGWVNKG